MLSTHFFILLQKSNWSLLLSCGPAGLSVPARGGSAFAITAADSPLPPLVLLEELRGLPRLHLGRLLRLRRRPLVALHVQGPAKREYVALHVNVVLQSSCVQTKK